MFKVFFASYGSLFIKLLIGIVITPYLISFGDRYVIYTTVLSLFSFLNYADLGIGAAVGVLASQNWKINPSLSLSYFLHYLRVVFVTYIVFIVLMCILILWPEIIFARYDSELARTYIASGIILGSNVLIAKVLSLYYNSQGRNTARYIHISFGVLTICWGLVVFKVLSEDILVYILTVHTCQIIVNVYWLRRVYKECVDAELLLSDIKKELTRFSRSNILRLVFWIFLFELDRVFLVRFLDEQSMYLFSVGYVFFVYARLANSAYFGVVKPEVNSLPKGLVGKALLRYTLIYMIVSVSAIIVFHQFGPYILSYWLRINSVDLHHIVLHFLGFWCLSGVANALVIQSDNVGRYSLAVYGSMFGFCVAVGYILLNRSLEGYLTARSLYVVGQIVFLILIKIKGNFHEEGLCILSTAISRNGRE